MNSYLYVYTKLIIVLYLWLAHFFVHLKHKFYWSKALTDLFVGVFLNLKHKFYWSKALTDLFVGVFLNFFYHL